SAKQRKHLHVRKGWRADARPVRADASVANEVVAIGSFCAFDHRHRFAGRNHWPPADAEEVMDQRLDVMHRARLGWRRGQRMLSIARPHGHVVDALLNDAEALAYLLDVDNGAVIAVTSRARGDVELQLVVASVRLLLAQVPFQPACA